MAERGRMEAIVRSMPPEAAELLESPVPTDPYQLAEDRRGMGCLKELRDTLLAIDRGHIQLIATNDSFLFGQATTGLDRVVVLSDNSETMRLLDLQRVL